MQSVGFFVTSFFHLALFFSRFLYVTVYVNISFHRISWGVAPRGTVILSYIPSPFSFYLETGFSLVTWAELELVILLPRLPSAGFRDVCHRTLAIEHVFESKSNGNKKGNYSLVY